MTNKSVKSFKAYQAATQHSYVSSQINDKLALLFYIFTCLTEEVGEIAGPLKRAARDNKGVLTPEVRDALAKELGDTLWTLTRLANALGFSLEEIARMNVKKINDRVKRNKIKGSGDNR
jgi:NTP pyrophosphatase (non-canonical NTP hydrolase)